MVEFHGGQAPPPPPPISTPVSYYVVYRKIDASYACHTFVCFNRKQPVRVGDPMVSHEAVTPILLCASTTAGPLVTQRPVTIAALETCVIAPLTLKLQWWFGLSRLCSPASCS